MATVGAGTGGAELNNLAVKAAQRWAATANDVVAIAKYVDALDVAGLELAGFDSTEAAEFKDAVDHLKTVADIFQGRAAQAEAFDFANYLAAFVGPDPDAA